MPIIIPARGLSRRLPAGWVRNAAFVLIAIGVIVLGGAAAIWFASSLNVDQRIAAIAAVLTFGALLLAVLAAILAIAGYRFTQRRPRLGIGLVYDPASDPLSSPGSPATTTITISPQITNFGTAPATNARVTLFFFGAAIIAANHWQFLGDIAVWYEVPILQVDSTIPVVLPTVVVRISSDNRDAKLWWQAVADRTHDSGSHLLNRLGPPTSSG